MKRKGKIAPICVTVLLSAYYIAVLIAAILLKEVFPPFVRVCVVIFNSALVALLIFVLTRRIREIDSGEYDDLDRY